MTLVDFRKSRDIIRILCNNIVLSPKEVLPLVERGRTSLDYRTILLKNGNQRTLMPHNSYTPVIKTNNGVNDDRSQANVPDYSEYNSNRYRDDTELKQHYWAASFLLPLGSIFVLSIVVLLMVLFKRCPHIIAGIVAGLLGTIVIFVILMSVNNAPVYT